MPKSKGTATGREGYRKTAESSYFSKLLKRKNKRTNKENIES